MEHDDEDAICGAACACLFVVGLSALLLYWDVNCILMWDSDLDVMPLIRQLWNLAMCISLSLAWFTLLPLVGALTWRKEGLALSLGSFILFVGGPNLFVWDVLGVVSGSLEFTGFCINKSNCESDVFVLAMRVCGWVVLYCLSGVCCYAIFHILRSQWRERRTQTRVRQWRTRVLHEFGQILVDANPDIMCSICLEPFKTGQKVTVLPGCQHQFHCECVQVWFERNVTCPICRQAADERLQDVELSRQHS